MNTVATKLNTFLDNCADKSFSLGEFDCCLFVADWVKCIHGFEPAPERGSYSTFKQGLNIIKSDFKGVFKARLNTVEIEIDYVKRGDIALCRFNDELVGGIVGLGVVHCVASEGLTTLPFETIECAYALEAIHE